MIGRRILSVALLVCGIVVSGPARASDTDLSSLRGSTAFASGQGYIALGGGVADFGVESIGTGLSVDIDGQSFSLDLDDRLEGQFFGARLSFNLPGQNEKTWLGRNMRLSLDVTRGWAAEALSIDDVRQTVDTSLFFTMVSNDGRAIAQSNNSTSAASALVATFGLGDAFASTCNAANGTGYASATSEAQASTLAGCFASPGIAEAASHAEGVFGFVAASRAILLSGTPFDVRMGRGASYDIEDTRGEAALTGDYDLGSSLVLSPSLALVAGRRQVKFAGTVGFEASDLAGDFFVFSLSQGRLVSQDAGIQGGSRVAYKIAPGLDLFASAKAAVLHRRSRMESSGFAGADIAGDPNGAASYDYGVSEEVRTRLAFRGQLEAGGSYEFGAGLGLGPIRTSLSGGLLYDSAVANYASVQILSVLDAPFAPAHIEFTGETDLFLKVELSLELP